MDKETYLKSKKEIEAINNKRETLESQRKEALSTQDAKKYKELCDELGIEPEDKYLYEVGEIEWH